jgi:hypothetical protein
VGSPEAKKLVMTMKRLKYILSILGVLILTTGALSVEKEKKGATPTPPLKSQLQDKKQVGKVDSTRRGAVKKFDDFVDRNNNGIDDRKENLTKKAPEKKEEKKDTTGAK